MWPFCLAVSWPERSGAARVDADCLPSHQGALLRHDENGRRGIAVRLHHAKSAGRPEGIDQLPGGLLVNADEVAGVCEPVYTIGTFRVTAGIFRVDEQRLNCLR